MSNESNSMVERLDEIQMPAEERELAKRQLGSIERTVDGIWELAAWLRPMAGKAQGSQPVRKRVVA